VRAARGGAALSQRAPEADPADDEQERADDAERAEHPGPQGKVADSLYDRRPVIVGAATE
jgi:hypothetical protein